MIEKPTVCAVMITADRHELVKRAVACFRMQTYANKKLLVFDTGIQAIAGLEIESEAELHWFGLAVGAKPAGREWSTTEQARRTIGELRNAALCHTPKGDDQIIIHWDDDDYSHPDRITEQVDLLQASGADLVAYNEMLFWRQATAAECPCNAHDRAYAKTCPAVGEAWVYTGGPIGTSFCYWRRTWERHPFEPTSYGEDNKFWRAIQTAGGKVTSVSSLDENAPPMMIARIHGSNTMQILPEDMRDYPQHWTRTPQHDDMCRKVLG